MSCRNVAFITGSSRGIGRAIAIALADAGYAVAVNCRHESPEAVDLVSQLNKQERDALLCVGDVSDYATVSSMRDTIVQQLGEVTALVNNAGFAQQKLFTDITPEEWQRMLQVHLTGAYNTCHVFLPDMIRNHRGSIVNVSSMWGQTGGSCEVHYSAAKAGLIGLTKALAKEVGPSGIRVNCVAPGVIMTDMMRGFDEQVLTDLADETPLMRIGNVQDVADAVAFLLSDKASFITGQVVAPNGGIVI